MLGLLLPHVSESAPRWQAPSGWGGVGRRVARRRLYPKPKHAWRIFAIALILLLPTGCLTAAGSVVGAGASAVGAYWDWKAAKKGEPVIVTPPIEAYSKEVQAAAAAEMKALAGPCPRDTVFANCSAMKRMVIDYGDLRRRIRAAKKNED